MFNSIKKFFSNFFHSRIMVVTAIMIAFFCILFGRIFYLQVLHGKEYQNNYTLSIMKDKSIPATRGTIYDRNGKVLAYDSLAYAVTFEDTGDYDTDEMNQKLSQVISIIESNGDTINTSLKMDLDESGDAEFTVSGTQLQRFLADVYGHTYITDLEYNSTLGYNEADATAQQVFDYLCDTYGIHYEGGPNPDKADKDETIYTKSQAMDLLQVRYAVAANAYQKYVDTTIASDVSEATAADIKEHSDEILGVDISEESIRKYNDSEYFSHILGYTGTISSSEYDELSQERDGYSLTDKVGKSGIEKVEETKLQGTKGKETVYVDNVGNILSVASQTDPVQGDDVYLTIDADLQEMVYNLLEQELANIIWQKMSTSTHDSVDSLRGSDRVIAIDDVEYALINNNVIDIDKLGDTDAGEASQAVYALFEKRLKTVIPEMEEELTGSDPTAFGKLDSAMTDYEDYIMNMLYDNSVIVKDDIDTSSDEYTAWKNGTISLQEYLEYCINSDAEDTSKLELSDKYADSSETYSALVKYIENQLYSDSDFQKLVYKYLIRDGSISGTQLCTILYEQGVLDESGDADYSSLTSGSMSAYDFLRDKIKNLEITPAQLALDPCNASCVIINPTDGEVLACVTYPGYDNNKLANNVDSAYYTSLTKDLSYPLLNYATQQRTAPGSTFKGVTATAALTEGVLSSPQETVTDLGIFEKVTPSPKCWIYPGTHGTINVSQAIEHSCNYFFYEMGYRLASVSGTYTDTTGLATLRKYAEAYGLGANTGIEITESEPQISDSDAVRSAIGQGTNNFTTTQIARYAGGLAEDGTTYNFSLIDKVTDSQGSTVEEFEPEVYNKITGVSQSTYDAIHTGMENVVNDLSVFHDVQTQVAGKTGTAQESTSRPSHSLFICYAPADSPQIAICTRIPYGYYSEFAADVTHYMIQYYFNEEDSSTIMDTIRNAQATESELGD